MENQNFDTVLLYDSWVAERSVQTRPIENIFHCYTFGLVLGQDFSASATAFRHHTTNACFNQLIWLFWCLLLAVEDEQNGAFFITVSKRSNPSLYRTIVNAIARKVCGILPRKDQHLIKKYVSGSKHVDLEQQKDVIDEIQRLKEQDIREQEEKRAKQKKKPEEAAPAPEQDFLSKPLYGLFLSVARNKRVSDSIPFHPNIRGAMLNPYANANGIECRIEVVDEDGNLYDIDIVEHLLRANPTGKFSKVQMLLTPVPHEDDSTRTMGYLVRFIVFDSSWNPGKTLNKMKEPELTKLIFPQYERCPTKGFPTGNFSEHKYRDTINYLQRVVITSDEFVTRYVKNDLEDYSNVLHVKHTLTMENALTRLAQFGADTSVLGVIQRSHQMDGKTRFGAIVPSEYYHTYMYESDQLFWYRDEICGLYERYFPDAPVIDTTVFDKKEDPPSPLIELGRNRVVTREMVHRAQPELARLSFTDDLTRLEFDAGNMVRKIYARQQPNRTALFQKYHALYQQHGKDWRKMVPNAEYNEVTEYEAFNERLWKIQDLFMTRFADMCKLDGHVENLNIPEALKAMLVWYSRTYSVNNSTFTFPLFLTDPEMGFYANATVRIIQYFSYGFNLVQPIFTALARGANTVYDQCMDKLRFHMLVFGEQETGKSHHVLVMLQKILIPGTWQNDDYTTDAADYGDRHINMMIRLHDEAEEYMVNDNEAKKNAKKANMKKTALTKGIVEQNVFQSYVTPSGQSVRLSRHIRTKTDYVMIGCSNSPRPSRSPFESRIFMITMSLPEKNPHFFKDSVENKSPELTQNAVLNFQRIQFASALINKAMLAGALCDNVEMQLWDDIVGRVLSNLSQWGMRQRTSRRFDQMKSVARQKVIELAIYHAYDVPGGPFYKKQFELAHLREVTRLCYIVTPIIVETITLHSEKVVDSDCGNVMRALFRYFHIDEAHYNDTPYELYANDKREIISFKKDVHNTNNGQHVTIDLNYIQVDCSLDTLAQHLSPHTEPMLTKTHVKGALERMAKQEPFTPIVGPRKRNGYAPMERNQLEMHRKKKHEKIPIDKKGKALKEVVGKFAKSFRPAVISILENINADVVLGNPMAVNKIVGETKLNDQEVMLVGLLKERLATGDLAVDNVRARLYEFLNTVTIDNLTRHQATTVLRGLEYFDHVPSADPYNQLRRAELTDYAAALIYFYGLEKEFLQLKGTPTETMQPSDPCISEDDIPQLANSTLPVVQIQPRRVCISPMAYGMYNPEIIFDAVAEAIILPSTRPQKFILGWTHPESTQVLQTRQITQRQIESFVADYDALANQTGALPRSQGIAFPRMTHASSNAEAFLKDPLRPAGKNKADTTYIARDLDYESAMRQHINAGFPIDEPVHDPKFLLARYRQHPDGQLGSAHYPDDLLAEMRSDTAIWDTMRLQHKSRDILDKAIKKKI